MKVAVIGSNGFMGKDLCDILTKDGLNVLKFSSSNKNGINSSSGLFSKNFKFNEHLDVVVYLSQSPFFREMPQKARHLFSVNQLSAVQAAIEAKNAGAKRFIYLSTGSIYAPSYKEISENCTLNKESWYALSKIHAEESLNLLCDEIEIIHVRPFGVFGQGQTDRLVPNIIKSVKNHNPINLSPREGCDINEGLIVSLIFLRDANEIIKHLVINGGPNAINLAGPEPISLVRIAQTAGKLIGIKPIFKYQSKPRNFDLIADITLLKNKVKPTFHSFEKALSFTLESD